MNDEQLNRYCLDKPGVTKDYHEDFKVFRFLVGGKMFIMWGGDKYEKPILTLKLEPSHGEALRSEYEDIVPGYYMNKIHWNSVYLEGKVPDRIIRGMIDESYRIVLESLPKKKQQEILSGKS